MLEEKEEKEDLEEEENSWLVHWFVRSFVRSLVKRVNFGDLYSGRYTSWIDRSRIEMCGNPIQSMLL